MIYRSQLIDIDELIYLNEKEDQDSWKIFITEIIERTLKYGNYLRQGTYLSHSEFDTLESITPMDDLDGSVFDDIYNTTLKIIEKSTREITLDSIDPELIKDIYIKKIGDKFRLYLVLLEE